MKLSEIREAFISYFESKDHTRVDSSSLIPQGDDTLLFTNAGMVQFKERFLGSKGAYSRATSSQRCVRAGGKHNDLENVGYTARHHTFFEMLGNFSFGDYFKREAIEFAWEFLTKKLGIPEEKLWITVYVEDDEAAKIWLQDMKVSAERFSRCGEKDNFWSMGDTGPCGPCTEIFYDHGPEIPGGPPGTPEEDGDRYVEIWNLVFMQYERHSDGSLTPLPKPSVDTGMGLERIAAVMQNVHSNYEVDLFDELIKAAAKILNINDLTIPSLKVIADHIRATSFLIIDGVQPSNDGRGYVLRRIIRRAIRHGHKLGATESFFYKMVKPLVDTMKDAYPELMKEQKHIETVLEQEEEQFSKTLASGMRILETALQSAVASKCLSGDIVFKLYDTYGFPVDLTADIAREREMRLDHDGFERCMQAQKERAKSASKFDQYQQKIESSIHSDFLGYECIQSNAHVEQIFKNEQDTNATVSGEEAVIILDKSPFYAESGGQVGDTGYLVSEEGKFLVRDTQKSNNSILHIGQMIEGEFRQGSVVEAHVDKQRRNDIRRNHSATHLLHAALRQVLGNHVQQKGSLVHPDYLRFDFSHTTAVSSSELEKITQIVNAQILANSSVDTALMTPEKAKASGAIALFGEKYSEEVRVLSMGGKFSVELCGGTHVERTGDIGFLIITNETGIAAGVRRIEALTGRKAIEYALKNQKQIATLSANLKTEPSKLVEKQQQLIADNKQLDKECQALKSKLASSAGSSLVDKAQKIGDVFVLIEEVQGADPKSMMTLLDQVKQKLGKCVVLLGTKSDDRVNLIAGVSKDMTAQLKAPELIKVAAELVGGRGGGRPDMAQAGGTEPAKLSEALNKAKLWTQEKLA
ncbi:MAG: alanine--tRNA ligase [Legionellales bacterium]|nr:alanine--tRNA ligase [Legionellales bacterium]